MIQVKCPKCGKNLKAPDQAAGKKAKCPGCQTAVAIPKPEPEADFEVVDDVEEVEEVLPAPEEKRVTTKPKRSAPSSAEITEKPSSRSRPKNGSITTKKRSRDDDFDDEDDEDYEDRPAKRKKKSRKKRRSGEGEYADCPNCGSPGNATRVLYTWWGGFLGPWLLTHVRCEDCGTCYNGKSGKDNTTAIVLYFVVPSLISLAICITCYVITFVLDASTL